MKLYTNVTVYFLIWLLGLLMIFSFGLSSFPQKNVGKHLIGNLTNWDGSHFVSIAQFGYYRKFQFAFFPLYPMAIRTVTLLTENYSLSALLISLVSTFLTLHILYRLISLDFGKRLAEKAIIFLLIFPTSFYLITGYSESFFLLLSVLSLYFLRKNNLVLATILAALVSAVRISGIAVASALIVQVLLSGGFNRKNWFVLLSPVGIILYFIYLFNATGDPLYFLTAESSHWQRTLAMPGASILGSIKSLAQPGVINNNFNAFLELLFAVFGLGLILRAFRFLPASYSIYGLLSILLPLTTSQLVSMPRFLLPIFPIFIILALIKNQRIIFLVQVFSLLLLSAFSMLFINGYWVS